MGLLAPGGQADMSTRRGCRGLQSASPRQQCCQVGCEGTGFVETEKGGLHPELMHCVR